MLGFSLTAYLEDRGPKAITIPGFIGFIARTQPTWAKGLTRRTIESHPEFEVVSDIIHGTISDGSVDGIFKADNYLKNYHGWLIGSAQIDLEENTKTPEIKISIDSRSTNG